MTERVEDSVLYLVDPVTKAPTKPCALNLPFHVGEYPPNCREMMSLMNHRRLSSSSQWSDLGDGALDDTTAVG